MKENSLLNNLIQWMVGTEGSSRSSALIRIGLVFLIWTRWAIEVLLFLDLSTSGVILSINFFLATTLMLIGFKSRFATAWTALVLLSIFFYFGHHLGRESWTHHHTYLLTIATCLCVLTPCGGSYSLDRWLQVRRAEREGREPPPERGNLWGLRLMALQLSVIYLWTAFDKSNVAFLNGDLMERYYMYYYGGSTYPSWGGFHGLMVLSSWATLLLEYALGIGLLFRPTRKWLILPGILLHALFYFLLPVRTYSATVVLLYLAYMDAEAVHRFIDRLSGWTSPLPPPQYPRPPG